MKPKDLDKLLKKNGWYEVRQSGSHRVFKHNDFKINIVVPMHNKDMKPGLLKQILKDAKLDKKEH